MELLTVQEAAQLLKVSPITVRRYIASGRLAAVKVGRAVRIRREAIEQLLMPVEPTSPPPKRRTEQSAAVRKGQPTSEDDPLWNIVGMVQSDDGPRDVARNKHMYLAEGTMEQPAPALVKPGSQLPPGEPTSADDPLWNIVGLIDDPDSPTDISENTDKYLAEAYASTEG